MKYKPHELDREPLDKRTRRARVRSGLDKRAYLERAVAWS